MSGGKLPSASLSIKTMVFHLNSCKILLWYHKQGFNGWFWSRLLLHHYRFIAYCLRNRDKRRDAAQCLACHRHDGISSELLLIPILVSQTRLRRLLGSCLLLRHYRFVAYCLRNCDKSRDAAKCLDCHQDYGISSELLLNPILISWFRLRQLLCSCLLQLHYHYVAYCLMTFKLSTMVVKAPSVANDTVASGEDNPSL
jgi:hypothetical protein